MAISKQGKELIIALCIAIALLSGLCCVVYRQIEAVEEDPEVQASWERRWESLRRNPWKESEDGIHYRVVAIEGRKFLITNHGLGDSIIGPIDVPQQ